MSIKCFTDGSSRVVNGKALCGWAFVIINNNKLMYSERGNLFKNPTNQRAELTAIYRCFKKIKSMKIKEIEVITDSMYSKNIIEEWWVKWNRNGQVDNKKNIDIIKPMMKNYSKITGNIKITHVNSHCKKPEENSKEYFYWYWNDYTDKLCDYRINN